MSDPTQSAWEGPQPALCPTCGSPLPDGARYCPNCGTRVQQETSYDPDAFRSAVDDVLDDQGEQEFRGANPPLSPALTPAEQETFQLPSTPTEPAGEADAWRSEPTESAWKSSATPPAEPDQPPTWTATPSDWTIRTPPPSAAGPPAGKRENRTLWIILAILGGIIFCCCATFFLLFAVSSVDSSFQQEVSLAAALLLPGLPR